MKISKLRGTLAIMLMMSMMSVISFLYPIKILLLGLLLVLCFKEARVCKQNRILCLCLCASTLLGALVGAFKGTEYPFYALTVGFLWPILSLIIVTPILKTNSDYQVMIKWIFFMHAFLVVYDLLYASSMLYGTPIINLYPEVDIGFSFYETTSRLRLINLNTLTFTTPLFFILYLTRYNFGINSKIQLVVMLLNVFLVIISGRRSLMLVFFLAPIFTILFKGFFPSSISKQTTKFLLFFLIIIGAGLAYVYYTMPEVFEGYLHTFTKAFDSSEESTRFNQAKMLMGHFEENPIFGTGSGAMFYEADRGIRQHQFEQTYLLMLATRGVIGFTLYLLGTIGVLFIGIKYARKRKDVLFICMLFAFFFVLVADATNPVLCSFDLMLPLFLCYAKINSSVFNYDNVRYI